jgi:putative two-component system response regulator
MHNRILIIDDCELDLEVLDELLRDGYELAVATSGEHGLEKLAPFRPGVVVVGTTLSGIDGYETCQRIKASPLGRSIQVILADTGGSLAEWARGRAAGADDFVRKPLEAADLLVRAHVQFQLRDARLQLEAAGHRSAEHNAQLIHVVQECSAEVSATRDVAIFALARLAESRDPEMGEHLERIRTYCRILAEHLQQQGPYGDEIDSRFIEELYRSSPLHDIGKVGIPDAILLKPGRLNDEEYEIMKRHTVIGAEALGEAARQGRCGGFLEMAVDIARHHHERFDGSGYPDGLAGQKIPLAARIVALADVYDALTSARVYKPAYDPIVVKSMIDQEEGWYFDPAVVQAFRARHDQFLEIVLAGDTQRPELDDLFASGDVRR